MIRKKIIITGTCLWVFTSYMPLTAQKIDRQAARDSLKAAVEVLSYHPDSINLRLRKASWNVELEQWEFAKEEYDYVLRNDSRNLDALYYRAFVNQKLHRNDFARLDYENLLKYYPGSFEGQLGLALLNERDNRRTEALDQINETLNNFPDSAVAWAIRAGMEKKRKMYDVAEYDYAEAVRLDPHNQDYRLSLVDVQILMGKKDAARKELDILVRQGLHKAALKDWYDKCK